MAGFIPTCLVTNNYQLLKNLELELNGQYYSKFRNAAATIEARWGLDFGLRKKFGGGQSLAFNVADIFNTFSLWDVNFNAPKANVQWNGVGNFEGPIFRLSFSTPFGNKNLKLGDKRTSKKLIKNVVCVNSNISQI